MIALDITRHWGGETSEAKLAVAVPNGVPEDPFEQRQLYAEIVLEMSGLLISVVIGSTPMPAGAYLRVAHSNGGFTDFAIEDDLNVDDKDDKVMDAITRLAADAIIESVTAYWDERGWSRPQLRPRNGQ
jgi:hypothetical protein